VFVTFPLPCCPQPDEKTDAVTSSAREEPSLDSGVWNPPSTSTRLWGTAHLTAAVLLVVAIAGGAIWLPGQELDVQPLPVPVAGWLVWISGIGYLAGCAVLHARTGIALRQVGTGEYGTWIAGALASGVVALAAGVSIGLGRDSRTYACGLETLTTVLCVAAALSVTSLIATCCFCRPGERRSPNSRLIRCAVLLHLAFAIVTAGGLLWLEQLPLSAAS
jgi:hypothetical protein